MKFIQEDKKEWYKDKTQDAFNEYIDGRNKRLKMSPGERASNTMGWFKFIYYSMYGKEPSREIEQQAYEIAIEYYKNNKFRIWCDPLEYKKLFTGEEFANTSALNIITSVVGQDMRDAKKNEEYESGRQKDLLGNYIN